MDLPLNRFLMVAGLMHRESHFKELNFQGVTISNTPQYIICWDTCNTPSVISCILAPVLWLAIGDSSNRV